MLIEETKLKRFTVYALAGFVVIELFAIPYDFPRYAHELEQYGLIGVLGLPSAIVFQLGLFAIILELFLIAFQSESRKPLRTITLLLGSSVVMYVLSIFLFYKFSYYGEFGVGALTLVGIFGVLLSSAFILIVAPLTLIYATRKRLVGST